VKCPSIRAVSTFSKLRDRWADVDETCCMFAVDYVHSETTVTALMVAAGRGFFGTVEQLLNIGANVSAVSSNEWTALDWARQFEQHDVTELLETHL